MVSKIKEKSIANNAITTSKLSAEVSAVTGIKVSSIAYLNDDTAANTVGGDVITVTGAGFTPNTTVYVDRTQASVVTYVSSTQLTFSSPAKSAGSYILYLYNADGGSAAYIPGINYSGIPAWSTASGSIGTTYEFTSFSGNVTTLSASSDTSVYYLLNSGSLPTGASLNANTGVITGNTSVVNSQTTYNFVIEAKDQENQGTLRNFSITINPDTVTWSSPADGATINGYVGTPVSQALSASSAAARPITYTANTLPSGLSISGNSVTGTPTLTQSITSLITATATTTNRTATRILNWIIAVASDLYFPYVSLLLKTTATNTQNNSTFLDSSTNNFTITRNGTPTQGSVTPYWPNGYWSNYNGTKTDYLSIANTAAVTTYTGDFTMECWVNPTDTSLSNGWGILDTRTSGSTATSWVWQLANYTTAGWIVQMYAGAPFNFTLRVLPYVWSHVVLQRNGGTLRCFVNGVVDSTALSFAGTLTGGSGVIALGNTKDSGIANYGNVGYISNLRVVNGTAVYSTSGFTPPTTPLTAITNTSLLTFQSNRFIDNSANNYALTANGTPRAQAFQPFSPTASYTAAAYGGSGYFSTSNYLTAPANTSWQFTGDYTLEAWIYLVSLASDGTIYGTGGVGAADQFTYTSTGQLFWAGQGTAAGVITTNQWLHVAAARSGTTLKIFVNGVTQLTATVSGTTGQNLTAYIARRSDGNNPVNGYISNLRIVNGTAVYTANFTPPTAPVTAIANTSLLLNCTNAGIYDAAVQNNQITVGDAQASTTVAKWSPTSMKFDGTGDWLTMPGANIPALSGQFTIEFWVYFSSISSTVQTICGKWNTSLFGWLVQVNNTSVQFSYGNGVTFTATLSYATTLTTGTWYYIAITRNSSNAIRAYLNGTAIGSPTTVSTSINSTSAFSIGVNLDGSQQPLNGYLQDFRLTNGVARTITTPTSEFLTR